MTIRDLRKELKQKLAEDEPIELGNLHKVNPFSRWEIVKEKTRELTAKTIGINGSEKIHQMFDEYDLLAIDWVHSEDPEWEGSLPHIQAQKILKEIQITEK